MTRMTEEQRIEKARAAHEAKRQATNYVVTWRGGGESQNYSGSEGFNALCSLLKVTGGSLYNYLCRGRGTHQFYGVNPTTGNDDIGVITRISPPAKEKRPVGRPRKHIDWARLGPEAPGYLREGYTEEPEFFPSKYRKSKK